MRRLVSVAGLGALVSPRPSRPKSAARAARRFSPENGVRRV